MVLSKILVLSLKDMDGHEIAFEDGIIMLKYPFIWKDGEKSKPSEKKWKEIYDAYWKDSRNEGYWIMKEAEAEFGVKK